MIISKYVTIKITNYNRKKYNKYIDDIVDGLVNIPINDLPNGSHQQVLCSCDNCGKEKKIYYFSYNKVFKKYNKYLCNKCVTVERKKTYLNNLGVEHPSLLKETHDKRKKTCYAKYNNYNYVNKEKKINTNLIKYGVPHTLQNKDIIKKIKKTNLERYGFESNLSNLEIREKIKKTNIERYGFEFPTKNVDVEKKRKLSYYITKKQKQKQLYDDIIHIDYEKNTYMCFCYICNSIYEISPHLYLQRKNINKCITCTNCNKIDDKTSNMENEVYGFITSNINNEIIKNDRTILDGKELDIYIPELKLAFEFNGLYWHSEVNKDNDYHLIKTNMCLEKGIQLIHIWEDDWLFKQDIVKSMIINKLKGNINRIFGRKCIVKEITDNKIIRTFLDDNHLQGFVGSKVKLGLYYNDELVSFMNFGSLRKVMNKNSVNNTYELLRFCNKLNTTVIGGASKLFKYFTRNYSFNSIVSYADRSHSNGNLYTQLGFKLEHITKPNYYYIIERKRCYRFGYRKDILVKQGYDPNKTEHEIMLERKIYRIYNAGNYKFIFKRT